MSEQTPESAASTPSEDGFIGSDPEPSMEDILASIRKIIADDADPLPLDGPSDDDQPALSIQAVGETLTKPDVRPAPVAASVDESSDSLDIEALLSELDEDETSSAALQESVGQAFGLTDDDVLTLDDQLAIPELDDAVIDVASVSVSVETVASIDAGIPTPTDDDADDMDRMMSELLSDFEDIPTPAQALDLPDTDAPVEAPTQGTAMADATTDADLDLVKSLMADLTDEDEDPAVDTLEAETVVTVDTESVDALDALEDDILESILDMTLDDEIAAMEAQARETDGPSLSDIAVAAETDAGIEHVAEAATSEDAVVETAAATPVDLTAADPKPVPQQIKPDTPKMEISMPRAIRSDAILDDVTEEATMSAFAQLNQVVEDQAILSERGPRIGDLVQDALKPMLKEWLDENLQGIVERAVAKEVKRLASGK